MRAALQHFRASHPMGRAVWIAIIGLWLGKLVAQLFWSYRPPFWLDVSPVVAALTMVVGSRWRRGGDESEHS